MDAATCNRVCMAMDAGVAESAEVLEEDFTAQDDVRRAVHIEVPPPILDLVEMHLDRQREAIAQFFGLPLARREGASLLRYEAGGFYRPHVDRAWIEAWPPAAHRQVTVVLFLNGCREAEADGTFSGGALRLFQGRQRPTDIHPRRGMLVGFPSTALHEVRPVMSGCRDTIVDWFSL